MIDSHLLVRQSKSVSEAMTKLSSDICPSGGHFLFYGLHVHIHSAARNDFVMEFSHCDALEGTNPTEMFLQSGGTATDIVVTKLTSISGTYSIDIPAVAKQMEATGDPRVGWLRFLIDDLGAQTAWIGAINAPWVGAYGVLNHMLSDRHAPAPLPEHELMPLAHEFHDAVRKKGLLTRLIGLTDLEILTLQLTAQGRTAEDISSDQSVSVQAVEQWLKRARKKLRARNSTEAIYKAFTYGVLPYKAQTNLAHSGSSE